MTFTTLLKRDSLLVFDYRCSARPGDAPFAERHDRFSLSYVRKGSFGYQSRGRFSELIAGSILVGHPGDEYVCTHDHVQATSASPSSSRPIGSRRSAVHLSYGGPARSLRSPN